MIVTVVVFHILLLMLYTTICKPNVFSRLFASHIFHIFSEDDADEAREWYWWPKLLADAPSGLLITDGRSSDPTFFRVSVSNFETLGNRRSCLRCTARTGTRVTCLHGLGPLDFDPLFWLEYFWVATMLSVFESARCLH